MTDQLPAYIALPGGALILAYVLLENRQHWARFLISKLKQKLGVNRV